MALTEMTFREIRENPGIPRIGKMKESEAVTALSGIIATAHQYTGRDFDDNTVLQMANQLYIEIMADEMKLNMKYLTIVEIAKLVKRGVLGQAGEMYGINVASIYKLLTDYCKGEGKLICDKILESEQHQIASGIEQLFDKYTQKLLDNARK